MSRISHHFLSVLSTCVMGVSTANLSAAAFSDENWSSMGNILNDGPLPRLTGGVWAIATDGLGNVNIGGVFTIAGGVFATNVAKWNGSSWNAVGSGMNGAVYALALLGGDLYAGGAFETAGGISATNIAKWNGSTWSVLGSGVSGPDNDEDYYGGWVSTLGGSGSDLYVGGHFTTAGGVAVNNIAKWNGSNWSALGSGIGGYGLNPPVWALAVSGNNLYTGGYFRTAGGKPSENLAKARISSIAKSVATTNSTATIQFSGVTGYQYNVQRSTNLHSPILWTTLTTSPLSPAPDGSFTFTDTNAPPGTAFYRARELP